MNMASQSPDKMMAAVTESMRERTGRTLEEWVSIVQSSGIDPLDQNTVRRWLRSEHGVLQNSQWAIADAAARAAGWEPPAVEEYIDQQYAGAKAALRPIFDRLRAAIEALGEDVTVEGRSTYTPFVRRRQFVAIAAATRSRVDVGLRYTNAPDSKLLTSATAPGQATHKLSLTAPEQVTGEVKRLLRMAYDQNG
jgi:predicted transport protein